jgi:hypothetical protein
MPGKVMKFWVLAVLCTVLECAPASALTYLLTETQLSNPNTHVSGFIETDGTLGVLTAVNIVNWDIQISQNTSAFELLGPTSGNNSSVVVDRPGALTATVTGLFYVWMAAKVAMVVSVV